MGCRLPGGPLEPSLSVHRPAGTDAWPATCHAGASRLDGLEPQVCDAPAISWEVLEPVQTIEVVDGDAGNRFGLRQPKVDRNSPPVQLQAVAPSGRMSWVQSQVTAPQ